MCPTLVGKHTALLGINLMHLHFLHGTETGTSEFLCDDLQSAISDEVTCTVESFDDLSPADMSADRHYVLVLSTFGTGEIPFTAKKFFEALEKNKPDLGHVVFSVFGLGDTTFDRTFNYGSEMMMKQMLACSAKMVGERYLFDASSNEKAEDVALAWLKGILADQEVPLG